MKKIDEEFTDELDEEYVDSDADEFISDINDPESTEDIEDDLDLSSIEVEELTPTNQLTGDEDLIGSGYEIIIHLPELDYIKREEMIINSMFFDAKKRSLS